MKSVRGRCLLILIAAGGAAGCWYFWPDNDKPAGVSEGERQKGVLRPLAPEAAARRVAVAAPVNVAAEKVVWPMRGTREFKRMALERGRKWLESRGRDAGSLIAMWDVCKEESLLLEAAEKFPNDPRVCLAMIARVGLKKEKAMPWVERLMAAEPNNPEALYLKAAVLMESGDRAGTLAALRTAAAMSGPRDYHLRERMLAVREGALASGAGTGDAAWISMKAALENSSTFLPHSAMLKILRQELADAKAGGSEERLLDIAGLGLGMAKQYGNGGTGLVVDTLVSTALERMVLKELSDETEIGTAGRTAAQMKAEAEERALGLKDVMKQATGNVERLQSAGDGIKAEFADRFLLHGEFAAGAWLAEQIAAAQDESIVK